MSRSGGQGLVTALVPKLLAFLALIGGALAPKAPSPQPSPLSSHRLLGQRIMVGLTGLSASTELLRRVREGSVGAVILFSSNIGSRSQLQALTSSLQRAARTGRNPPLLIATDQEGGAVKRLADGPPSMSPPQIASAGDLSTATEQGIATGTYLRGLGINMNLAPVVDVPTSSQAFIWQQGRAFSFDPDVVSRYATAFALGLQQASVAATAKHFPGLGSAAIDTDNQLQELHPSPAQLQAALLPYRSMIRHGAHAVMISVAGFPAYDPTGAPAALSRPIIEGLLRRQLGFTGVTITDSLAAPTGHDPVDAGVLAARAGADILLYTGSAPSVLPALERALSAGQIARADALRSYERIVALKQAVAPRAPTHDTHRR